MFVTIIHIIKQQYFILYFFYSILTDCQTQQYTRVGGRAGFRDIKQTET